MGGCRCTYRNCTVKSDGKTHMFHYPVFDKIRCHQWLVNAHRLDFLNLKVSQLKNRVVCQHHFKEENFMNFKRDKLTFEAVPTEDGPYCDTDNYVENNQEASRLYTVIIDDIENEYIPGTDKKANFSMKYGDFLTNFDLIEIDKVDKCNNTYEFTNSEFEVCQLQDDKSKVTNEDSLHWNVLLPEKVEKQVLSQPKVVPAYVNSNNLSLNDTVKTDRSCNSSNVSIQIQQDLLLDNNTKKEIKKDIPKKQPRITIISEKKITSPVPIVGKFEPVSPNFVLHAPQIKRDATTDCLNENTRTKQVTKHKKPSSEEQEDKKIKLEIGPIKEEDISQASSSTSNLMQNTAVPENRSKLSLLKPRVPPERIEAIKKKRKFNMKLRDIIESCLDKLEHSDKVTDEINTAENVNIKKIVNHANLRKESAMLPSQDYTIAFLESRMKKMENTLLQKIDQNTSKINELKKIYAKKIPNNNPSVQFRADEATYKKQLFQEISKYLSPNTKSLIYEEMFINKFSLGETNTSDKRKRRRCI